MRGLRAVGAALIVTVACACATSATFSPTPAVSVSLSVSATPEGPTTASSTGPPSMGPLRGDAPREILTDWRLTGGDRLGGPIQLVPDANVTLTIAPARVHGQSACNNYQADLLIDRTRFAMELPAMSAMLCGDERDAFDDGYISGLMDVQTWAIEDDRLVLRGPETELRFARIEPLDLSQVVGYTYFLEEFVDADGATVRATGAAGFLLMRRGDFEGSTGCRDLEGQWIERAGQITMTRFEAIGDCAKRDLPQDRIVIQVLGDGFNLETTGGRLILSKDGLELRYRAVVPV